MEDRGCSNTVTVSDDHCKAVIMAEDHVPDVSWCGEEAQLRALEGFHVECARRLTGLRPRRVKGKWVYPKSAEVLKKANLKPLRHYIQKRRHTVHNTISARPVLKECKGAARLKGSSFCKYC